MTSRILCATLLLSIATSSVAADRKLVASETGAAIRSKGKILITNDGSSVVAWQFHGSVRRSLVRIRSSASLQTHYYGPVLYDSGATMRGGVPPHLAGVIREAAREHGIDPRLVAAVAWRESAFNANAVSHRGASGVMQLMPATAQFLGVADIFDVRQNIFGGTRYLRMLLDTFRGDLDLALAAYNAGPGAVERYQGVPPYQETLAYVRKVRGDYEKSLRAGS